MTELRASDTVAAKIRSYREWLGWSRRKMAEHCGLSESVIENIETGRVDADGVRRRDVTIDELLIIARTLDLSPLDLLPAEASQPTFMEEEEARRRREQRQELIALKMSMIDEEERRLRDRRRERAAIDAALEESVAVIELLQQEIMALQAERD
jgi:transcriptional regulator with XRE-family HTH domain